MFATRKRPAITAAAGLALACMVLAGCGGSSSGTSNGHGSESGSRTAAQLKADRALARQALLELSDFPQGWQATPHEDDEGPDFGKQLADCLNVPEDLLGGGDDNSVDSPDFQSPHNQEVSNTVSLAPSADQARRVFDILQQPNATKCFGEAIDKVLQYSMSHDSDAPKNVELGKVTLGQLNLPQFADESIAFRTRVPLTASGVNADVYLDLVFMRHDRATTIATFLDVFSPFPLDETKHYAKIAARRLTSLDL